MRKYFGTDGIRGRANEFPMTASFALRLGQAAAARFMNGKKIHRIVIGKDTRISGYMFENALVAGICSMGADAVLLGVQPTPAVAYITRSVRADAGIVISASHNPYHDNGIKFFNHDGFKLPDEVEMDIERITEELVEKGEVPISADRIGKAYRLDTAVGRYVEFAKSSFEKDIDLMGLKIVVDCANGATYKVAPHAFVELGADIKLIGDEPNGYNINAGYGAVAPERMAALVKETGADIGISFDGDGDRLIVADENGVVVDGDLIMGICANYLNKQKKLNKSTVVATVMSNYGFEKSLETKGIKLIRSNVGDRYVLEEMVKNGYNLGGEQSGHLIFSDHNTTGDGLISSLQLLSVMVREGKPLSELKKFIELCPQVLNNVIVKKKVPLDQLPKTTNLIAKAEKDLEGSGRILVRYSGTENKLRVMVEGEDADKINSYAQEIADSAVKEIEAVS